MTQLYRTSASARVKFALEAARSVSALKHAGVKGAIRELLVADLFRPLLPADIGVATGTLISSYDNGQSAQQDIIIFNRRILPPMLFSGGLALIPVESAIAAIEVKSRLTAAELQAAHANAISIRALGMMSGTKDGSGKFVDTVTSSVTSLLFALDTDLSPMGKTEQERYTELFGDEPPIIRGIVVAGRGAWWPSASAVFNYTTNSYETPDGAPFRNSWTETKSDAQHSEILQLLVALYTLIEAVTASRGRPPLSRYLMQPG